MDVDRVALDDFNTVPQTEEWLTTHVQIVPFTDFISVTEPTADSLLGTSDDTILPAGGMLLMYGDGGAGKTTLTIDAITHLAAGQPWLGLHVDKAATITLIENEGPRGKFRQLLKEKATAWNGNQPFAPHVHVLEEPWTRFTLKDEDHRTALALHVTQTNTDIIVMGPLATLGMVGGGTPDEINVFEFLLRQVRLLIPRAVAFWIVHHENKAGDVSGAWERVPDTLVHVQAHGNGHTHLVWRKARWSSVHHGTSLDLAWAEGRSYELKEHIGRDLHSELRAKLGTDWLTAKEIAKDVLGANIDHVRQALSDLAGRGEISFQTGPPGRHPVAKCYRQKGDSDATSQPESPVPLWGSERRGDSLTPPYKGESLSESPLHDPQGDSTERESVRFESDDQHPAPDDDDIPF